MKTTPILFLAFICLAVSAPALTIGNTGGYLLDHKQPYLTARIGGEFFSSGVVDHLAEIEFGYTSSSDNGIKTQLLPATLNYRAQFGGTGPLGGYLGLGAGMARTRVTGFGAKFDDWQGFSQAFAGVSFALFKNGTLDLGARYVRISDVHHFDRDVAGGDDTVVEAGFHFRF